MAWTTKTESTPSAVDLRMAKALSHPIRVQILTILHKRIASPNQIAQELGEGLSQVSYHVKVLRDFNCIELVRTEPRRGAVEHFYRATARSFLTDREFESLSPDAQQDFSLVSLQIVIHDVMESLEAGIFNSREDRHFSRTPLIVDEEGWNDISALLAETLDRVLDIQVECSARLAKSKEKGIITKVNLFHFEAPEFNAEKDLPRSKS